MSHFVAYILQFQEILVFKIPPRGEEVYSQPKVYICCSHMAKTGFLMMWLILFSHIYFPELTVVHFFFCLNTLWSSSACLNVHQFVLFRRTVLQPTQVCWQCRQSLFTKIFTNNNYLSYTNNKM